MTAFNVLAIIALAFFVAHVVLLFTSFGKNGFQKTKYLYSHITLWICGVVLFLLASLYAGKQVSTILDVFDTPLKQAMIIGIVMALSFTAHTVIKFLVMPKYNVNRR